MLVFVLFLCGVTIVGLSIYIHTYTCSPTSLVNTTCPECPKCPSGFLPTVSSEGLLRPSPFVILESNYIPDQNTYTKFYGSGWTINTNGQHVCPQKNIFSRIFSKVDSSTPEMPLRDELVCLTPEDSKYNCRMAN